MPTFGFSAFLKLISLNTRPQRSLIRTRSAPSSKSGFDFHRSLKLLSHRLVVGVEPLSDLLLAADSIAREPEKLSAKAGLEALSIWRGESPGRVTRVAPVLYESPAKNFKVQYQPNFGVEIGGQNVAVHIWNTVKPDLDIRMTYAALSFFPAIYASEEARPDDLAVLSLRDSRLYRLGEVPDHSEMGLRLMRRLDDIFEEIRHEPTRPITPPKGRPTTPPKPF